MANCIRSTSLLLLPGMMCDATLWSSQVEAFEGDYSVTIGDLTGASNITGIADQLLAEAAPRFALAGLSMGGIVALEMWRRAPERIERLALLDTNFRCDSPERRRLRDRQIKAVNSGGLERVLREELKPNYLASCHRDNTMLLDGILTMGLKLGADVFTRQSLALRDRPDSTDTLASLDCPTLVLCGEEDSLCTPALHEEMAALITGAELEIIPDCGHLSALEQPAQVNDALSNWMNK